MNTCMRISTLALLVSFGASSSFAAPAKLASLKGIFGKSLDKINQTYEKRTTDWPKKYLAALKNIQDARRKKGDLENYQVIQKEIDRFQKDQKITPRDLVDAAPPLRQTQETFMGREDHIALEKSRAVLALAEQYRAHLSELKKTLTMDGKIDEAVAADAELKNVRAYPEVSAAEFIVAAHQAEQKQPEPEPATPQPGPAEEKPVAPSKGTVVSSPGVKVYDKNERPASDPAIRYKRLLLRPLKLIPGGASVSVSALHAPNSRTVEKKHNALHATYTYKEEESDNHIRLSLRTGGVGSEVRNAVVAVQVVAKDVAATSGRAATSVLGVKHAALPSLTTSYTYIDYPPAKTKNTELKQRTIGRSDPRNKRGQEFYGIIITVFDASGSILYQGGTDKSLQAMALTQLPETATPRAPKEQPGITRPGPEQPGGEENVLTILKDIKDARTRMETAQAAYFADKTNPQLKQAYNKAIADWTQARKKMDGKWSQWRQMRDKRQREKGMRGKR